MATYKNTFAKLDEGVYKDAAFCYIDEKMADDMRYGNWIIPFMTTCSGCSRSPQGGHWTLLHYSVRENQWTFYNPDVPQTGKDHHYLASNLLVSVADLDRAFQIVIGILICVCDG